ncbi:MAG: TatD family hydrolase [bacterium]
METFIDFHCHLADEQYSYQEALNIVETCQKEKVILFSMSTDLNDYQTNLKFSNSSNVFIGFGIHPYEAHKIIEQKNWQEKIEEILKNKHPKLLFIGEVGLDFYKIPETAKEQTEVFEYFVYLATKYELPLSLHTRNAEEKICQILLKYQQQILLYQ